MTDSENNVLWNEYFYPDTDILINNLDIRDFDKLKEAEATYSFNRLLELNEKPMDMGFGKEQLKALHKYIFGDVYPFAGEYRKVNMMKKIGSFVFIKSDNTIDEYLDELFSSIENELSHCYSMHQFSEVLARLYTQLIYCHPFREGNGRTIREFVREYSIAKSREIGLQEVELDWRLIDRRELDQYLEVAHMYPAMIGLLFGKALVPVKNDNINRLK